MLNHDCIAENQTPRNLFLECGKPPTLLTEHNQSTESTEKQIVIVFALRWNITLKQYHMDRLSMKSKTRPRCSKKNIHVCFYNYFIKYFFLYF